MWKSLMGMLQLEITSAAPAEMLTTVTQHGILLTDIVYSSDLTVLCRVRRCDYRRLISMLKRRGESAKIVMRIGSYWTLRSFTSRPVLLFAFLLIVSLNLIVPTRVLFVEVKGNHNISKNLIIEKAEACGISFGASRREVRSEQIKNSLLSAIPELQWVGVNTVGCTAIISVVEKTMTENHDRFDGVNSIVAARDGVVCYQSVLQGNALCKIGDAVKRGQILVSGYTDCGLSIKAMQADAEIFAQTIRDISLIMPPNVGERQQEIDTTTKYSLIIGKKLIKLSLDSGISDASCVKMYKKYVLTLPGGFQLPIALMQEKIISYQHGEEITPNEADAVDLRPYADNYLLSQMVSGRISSANTTTEFDGSIYKLTGRYACIEMIGEIQKEEFVEHNGEDK